MHKPTVQHIAAKAQAVADAALAYRPANMAEQFAYTVLAEGFRSFAKELLEEGKPVDEATAKE